MMERFSSHHRKPVIHCDEEALDNAGSLTSWQVRNAWFGVTGSTCMYDASAVLVSSFKRMENSIPRVSRSSTIEHGFYSLKASIPWTRKHGKVVPLLWWILTNIDHRSVNLPRKFWNSTDHTCNSEHSLRNVCAGLSLQNITIFWIEHVLAMNKPSLTIYFLLFYDGVYCR